MPEEDILSPNPFSKRVLAKEGNAEARDIYIEVGLALDRWEHCEVSFGTLYSSLIETPKDNTVLMRSFGTITAASSRREMLSAACDAFFHFKKNDELKARVVRVLKLHEDAASRRNEIAHAVVMGDSRAKVVEKVAVPLPTLWFLVPPLFATRKTEVGTMKPKYRYSSKEIDQFRRCFEELGSRAQQLAREVRLFRASLDE